MGTPKPSPRPMARVAPVPVRRSGGRKGRPIGTHESPVHRPSQRARRHGTEPWADDGGTAAAGDPTKRRPVAYPVAPSEESAAIEGSPADPVPD